MKRLAACIAAFGIASALAADPARLAEARALMKSLQVEKQIDAMMHAVSAGMAGQMSELGGKKRDPRVARIAMEESAAIMRERATRPGGLIDAMAEAYADEFTLDELRQIRAFHDSPVGKHMLESSPRMIQRVMASTPIVTKDTMAQMCQRMKERLQREKIDGAEAMKCGEAMK